MKLFEGLVRVSTAVQTVPPEAARSLELAWQRRRQELGDWRPSRGWLTEMRAEAKRVPNSRTR